MQSTSYVFVVILYKLVATISSSLIQINSSVGFEFIYTILTCAEHLTNIYKALKYTQKHHLEV